MFDLAGFAIALFDGFMVYFSCVAFVSVDCFPTLLNLLLFTLFSVCVGVVMLIWCNFVCV